MDEAQLVRASKFLSKHLRHQPQRLGLTLEPGGWVAVDALLSACQQAGMSLSRAELDEIVRRNTKQRFAFDMSSERIRANQGHTAPVDLQLEPVTPSAILYHGTGYGALDAILREGLKKMRRHHVHLSADMGTARTVGRRHGRAVVLRVAAGQMAEAGIIFFRSENGVWLVDAVAPAYLTVETETPA